ncbi:unnamed protein product [Amoebophrya sp. A25]|nr:unnamed protein product [Amoebophrya sp. A25]|eukprot:GSA25T00012808001.1
MRAHFPSMPWAGVAYGFLLTIYLGHAFWWPNLLELSSSLCHFIHGQHLHWHCWVFRAAPTQRTALRGILVKRSALVSVSFVSISSR